MYSNNSAILAIFKLLTVQSFQGTNTRLLVVLYWLHKNYPQILLGNSKKVCKLMCKKKKEFCENPLACHAVIKLSSNNLCCPSCNSLPVSNKKTKLISLSVIIQIQYKKQSTLKFPNTSSATLFTIFLTSSGLTDAKISSAV